MSTDFNVCCFTSVDSAQLLCNNGTLPSSDEELIHQSTSSCAVWLSIVLKLLGSCLVFYVDFFITVVFMLAWQCPWNTTHVFLWGTLPCISVRKCISEEKCISVMIHFREVHYHNSSIFLSRPLSLPLFLFLSLDASNAQRGDGTHTWKASCRSAR